MYEKVKTPNTHGSDFNWQITLSQRTYKWGTMQYRGYGSCCSVKSWDLNSQHFDHQLSTETPLFMKLSKTMINWQTFGKKVGFSGSAAGSQPQNFILVQGHGSFDTKLQKCSNKGIKASCREATNVILIKESAKWRKKIFLTNATTYHQFHSHSFCLSFTHNGYALLAPS